MTNREDLEAEIAAIEDAGLLLALQTPENRRRHLATALLSSGYTKCNGELVEAVRAAKKFAEIIATGSAEGDNYRASEIVNICERALSDSEGLSPSGGDDWQPIETAPKDGTPVLLWAPGAQASHDLDRPAGVEGYQIGWFGEPEPYLTGQPDWVCTDVNTEIREGSELTGSWEESEWVRCNPTHWMPLPTPPAQDTQRAERATNGGPGDAKR